MFDIKSINFWILNKIIFTKNYALCSVNNTSSGEVINAKIYFKEHKRWKLKFLTTKEFNRLLPHNKLVTNKTALLLSDTTNAFYFSTKLIKELIDIQENPKDYHALKFISLISGSAMYELQYAATIYKIKEESRKRKEAKEAKEFIASPSVTNYLCHPLIAFYRLNLFLYNNISSHSKEAALRIRLNLMILGIAIAKDPEAKRIWLYLVKNNLL